MAVYFIRQGVTGPVKIGFAADVVKRLRQLQTNQPVALRILRVVEGDRATETALHQRFSASKLSGEWFSFSSEMTDADLGLVDLPIPLVKRSFNRGFPENSWGREAAMHHEILLIVGGRDALARRLRVAPWSVGGQTVLQRYWSALALLLADAGRPDITLDVLFAAREAVDAERRGIDEHNRRIKERRAADEEIAREREWVARHGEAAAWWPLRPETLKPRPAAEPARAGVAA